MNTDLFFDFTVDKAAKTVYITREFDAEPALVWEAFTQAELLDQWTAPKPWTAKTKYMHFEVGKRRVYAMVSPEGQVGGWIVQEYTSITPITNFKFFNCFADEQENLQLPGSNWDFTFSDQGGRTKVRITIYNESRERMEKMLEMGFKEGFTLSLQNLRELLDSLSKK